MAKEKNKAVTSEPKIAVNSDRETLFNTERLAVSNSTAAYLLDMSPTTFWRRIKDGSLPPPVIIGGTKRHVVAQLRKALQDEAA